MNIREKIVSSIYPRRCPVCGGIVCPKGGMICSTCRDGLPYINGARCRKCSKPLHDERIEYCYDCSRKKHYYSEGISLFEHKGNIKDAIYAVKYNNKREYLDFFADEIVYRYGIKIKQWDADVLIPVPLHKRKEVKRGFNQAMELASRIGKRLGIPVNGKAVRRVLDTVPQKELTDIERKKNVENAFIIEESIVKFKKVIIIDDIYTTGSTIDSCAKALLGSGVREVYFLTLSIGDGI